MDKFTFDSYSTPSETVFSSTKGYSNPTSETETRNQLSKPLVELKTFINKTVAVDGNDKAVQLSVRGGTLKYRLSENDGWTDVISGSSTPDTETIATNDRLIFYDNSKSKIAKSSIQFGSNANKFLRNDGTWQSISNGMIDVENVLLPRVRTNSKTEYTASEDCIAIIFQNHDEQYATINGVNFTPYTIWYGSMILKAGDTLVLPAHGSWQHALIVFGLRS